MSGLDEYLTRYIAERALLLEKYVLNAFDNEEKQFLCPDSLNESASDQDIKNCEFLKDAEIFSEETTFVCNGDNRCRVFRLTKKGQDFAEKLRQ
ncbi:MAG: hypothetical protein ACBZ72_11620 [Candidatus Bathyarchaeia archaeon]|jgi:hypothetical protein